MPDLFCSQPLSDLRLADRVAITDGANALTYRQLADRVGVAATSIVEHAVRPGGLLGIPATNSLEAVVAVMSALAAGVPFVPIAGPDAVSPRIRALLAGVLAVPGSDFAATANALAVPSISLDRAPAGGIPARVTPPVPDELVAYVIATSGSSGEPKETVVTRRGLRTVFAALRTRLAGVLPDGARWTHSHPLTFGYSVCEILGCWTFGGEFVVVPRDERTTERLIQTCTAARRPHVVCLTPSELALLVARLRAGSAGSLPSHLILSGEPAHKAPLREVFALPGGDRVTVVNTYAATETSGQITAHVVNPGEIDEAMAGLVGEVLPGITVTLRRPDGAPVARTDTATVGEIHVGGPTVAQRYLSADHTAARFRPGSEFATGDLGRWSERGLRVVGRADRTVKIAGQLVCLDSVERLVMRDVGVAEAAAFPDRIDAHDGLHVVVVPGGRRMDPRLRRQVVRSVGLKVTIRLSVVARMPRLPSGKADTLALSGSLATRNSASSVAHANVPAIVRTVWTDVLGAGVATDVNLFELGVDSLGLVAVAGRLSGALGRAVTAEFLLDHPRIDLQIAALSGLGGPSNGDRYG